MDAMEEKMKSLRSLGYKVSYGAMYVYVDELHYTWDEFMLKNFPKKSEAVDGTK